MSDQNHPPARSTPAAPVTDPELSEQPTSVSEPVPSDQQDAGAPLRLDHAGASALSIGVRVPSGRMLTACAGIALSLLAAFLAGRRLSSEPHTPRLPLARQRAGTGKPLSAAPRKPDKHRSRRHTPAAHRVVHSPPRRADAGAQSTVPVERSMPVTQPPPPERQQESRPAQQQTPAQAQGAGGEDQTSGGLFSP
jgi:hypothetical protein